MDPDMISDSIRATVDHIAGVNNRIERLKDARANSVRQLAHRIHQDYAAGIITTADLLVARQLLRAGGAGWSGEWQAVGLPGPQWIRAVLASEPNAPAGSWQGTGAYATPDNPMPPNGRSVVYVLYDHDNQPCYLGSSEQFRTRLRVHIKDGKPVKSWSAFPCRDRDDAYRLEFELLQSHKPYLNSQTRDSRWEVRR